MTVQPITPAAAPVGFPDEGEVAAVGRLAETLAKSAIVPGALRGKPADLFLVLLTARDLGIAPTFGLSKIHVVDGKPTLAAEAMLALGLQHGHDLWVEETTSSRAVAKGRRRGSDRVQEVVYTIDDAAAAGLAGKGPWKAHPAAMLRARAISSLCRFVIPDVLMGVSYTPDEAEEAAERDRVAPVAPVALGAALRGDSVTVDEPEAGIPVQLDEVLDDLVAAANDAKTTDDLQVVWLRAQDRGALDERVELEGGSTTLRRLVTALVDDLRKTEAQA